MSDTTTPSALLVADELHKHYRMGGQDLHILRGVQLSAKRGEWLAVVGASGSGKSTLLHLLGGLDRPDEGAIEFDGRDIFAAGNGQLDKYRRRGVGFVFRAQVSFAQETDQHGATNLFLCAPPVIRELSRPRRRLHLFDGTNHLVQRLVTA